MVTEFVVDRNGWIWSKNVQMNVNIFQQTGALLMSGKYEASGFGMTPLEKEAAIYLGLFKK